MVIQFILSLLVATAIRNLAQKAIADTFKRTIVSIVLGIVLITPILMAQKIWDFFGWAYPSIQLISL